MIKRFCDKCEAPDAHTIKGNKERVGKTMDDKDILVEIHPQVDGYGGLDLCDICLRDILRSTITELQLKIDAGNPPVPVATPTDEDVPF